MVAVRTLKTHNDIVVQTGHAIDLEACLEVLTSSFAAAPFQADIFNMFTPGFYRWKYSAPAGDAVVISGRADGSIVSMLAAVPFLYSRGGAEAKGWQICDIATRPQYRGRGWYRRCLQALVKEVGRGDLLICFPNRNSSHELFKQHFSLLAELSVFGRPVLPRFGEHEDSEAPNAVPASLSLPPDDCPRLSKHLDYMLWRYFNHPLHRYFVHVERRDKEPDGVIVMRRFTIWRFCVGVIMELHAANNDVRSRLLTIALDGASRDGLKALLLASSDRGVHRSPMFWPIPAFLTPKRHVVVGRLAGDVPELPPELNRQWHFQIGDWDGL